MKESIAYLAILGFVLFVRWTLGFEIALLTIISLGLSMFYFKE